MEIVTSWAGGKIYLLRYTLCLLANSRSLVLNPKGKYYTKLKQFLSVDYEDTVWAEDALFLERNSRDFVSRIERINHNAEAVCDLVMKHPKGTPHNSIT